MAGVMTYEIDPYKQLASHETILLARESDAGRQSVSRETSLLAHENGQGILYVEEHRNVCPSLALGQPMVRCLRRTAGESKIQS
jgi:hypothetical protein